jgi:hypothetical protein
VTADTDAEPVLSDDEKIEQIRVMLAEIHVMLCEIRPYLPLLEKAARFLDNPAARFRRKRD